MFIHGAARKAMSAAPLCWCRRPHGAPTSSPRTLGNHSLISGYHSHKSLRRRITPLSQWYPSLRWQVVVGVPAMAANVAGQFTLNRGEVVQMLQPARLAGSTLQSDKPIRVWGGSSCMNIPDGTTACDAAHQQLLPIPMLGNQYTGVRYPSRGG